MKSTQYLESLEPKALQELIATTPEAAARVLAYLDEQGIRHAGVISARSLGQALELGTLDPGRRWREYVEARSMPRRSRNALLYIAFHRRISH
jgi:hypothetical protein